jgi:hypothetical protein
LRSETIVVADADFFCGHRVVFIHDGQQAELKQFVHGVFGVEKTAAVFHIFQRHEYLGYVEAMFERYLLVGIEQHGLPAGRGRLLLLHAGALAVRSQRVEPERHRAGGREYDFVAAVAQRSDVAQKSVHERVARPQFRGVCQQAGTHFDDDPRLLSLSGLWIKSNCSVSKVGALFESRVESIKDMLFPCFVNSLFGLWRRNYLLRIQINGSFCKDNLAMATADAAAGLLFLIRVSTNY